MTTYSKQLLSGSSNGKPIIISASATPGTLIHTAVAGTSDFDEIWLWAVNIGATDVTLTLEWGGTVNPNDIIPVDIVADKGLILIAPGLLLQNELVIRAFAGTADVIGISGFVNRIIT